MFDLCEPCTLQTTDPSVVKTQANFVQKPCGSHGEAAVPRAFVRQDKLADDHPSVHVAVVVLVCVSSELSEMDRG